MDRDWSLPERDVTPEAVYLSRRQLLSRGSLALAAGATLGLPGAHAGARAADPGLYPAGRNAALSVDLPLTDEDLAIAYNNFYEFGTDKRIAARAQSLETDPCRSRSAAWSSGRRRSPSRTWSVASRSRSASTASAASRPGRWSCPGPASHSRRYSTASA